MNIIYILLGLNVSVIFLFNKTILDNKFYFKILLTINIVLFLIASLCLINNIGTQTAIGSLFVPLISQTIYYVMSKLFYMKYNKYSEDTFWTMDRSLFTDGWFNYAFWVISLLLFIFVL